MRGLWGAWCLVGARQWLCGSPVRAERPSGGRLRSPRAWGGGQCVQGHLGMSWPCLLGPRWASPPPKPALPGAACPPPKPDPPGAAHPPAEAGAASGADKGGPGMSSPPGRCQPVPKPPPSLWPPPSPRRSRHRLRHRVAAPKRLLSFPTVRTSPAPPCRALSSLARPV